MPEISVVIPTYLRPDLVVTAVADALAQTLSDIEVIVVVDGVDDETISALEAVEDDRLQVVVPPRNLGNAAARNLGISKARAEWIALLDDDDRWSPEKLELQIAAARSSPLAQPIVTCRVIGRHESAEYAWPRSLPEPGQPISEYLFCRKTPATGEGMVHTSTILARKSLFEAVPFDDDLARYVDLDWMLRAAEEEGVGIVFAGDGPLSVWSIDEDRVRISNATGWKWDVEFARDREHLLTGRAHAAFLLTLASIRARRAGDTAAFWPILKLAAKKGRFSPAELAFHVGNRVFPPSVRDRLTARKPLGSLG